MPSFKVIVIGSGPVGLTAAHALSKAGIDFVVLERRPDILEDVGASIFLAPHNLRVLSQFGLLPKLREIGHHALRSAEYTDRGLYEENWYPYIFQENHGIITLMFHRAELLRALYEGLRAEDQARIHVDKKLANIENTSDGVVVTCADGSTYEGSIVLGADGVHSQTRRIMRELCLKASPDADVDDEVPFSVEYRCMWCSFPRRYEYTPGDHFANHGNGASLQFLTTADRSWIFLYEKLDKPTKERVFYTEADMEGFAAKYADMRVGDRLRVKDVFPHRVSGSMANLEEGILKHWSGGRIVLAGDACHKFTPNAGQGLNSGIQDIVLLVNELHRCLESVGQGGSPSQDELTALFKRYQEQRKVSAQMYLSMSAHVTRLSAWANTTYWLVDQYVIGMIPSIKKLLMKYRASPDICRGLCLDFVEGVEPFQGKIPWVHPIRKSASESPKL